MSPFKCTDLGTSLRLFFALPGGTPNHFRRRMKKSILSGPQDAQERPKTAPRPRESLEPTKHVKYALLLVCRAGMSWRACRRACGVCFAVLLGVLPFSCSAVLRAPVWSAVLLCGLPCSCVVCRALVWSAVLLWGLVSTGAQQNIEVSFNMMSRSSYFYENVCSKLKEYGRTGPKCEGARQKKTGSTAE